MAKKNAMLGWLMWAVSLFVTLGVGGLFLNGTFLNVMILEWFPEVVHTIVGWVIIAGAVWEALQKFMK